MNAKNWLAPLAGMIAVSLVVSVLTTRYILNQQFMPAVINEMTHVEAMIPRLATINTEQLALELQEGEQDQIRVMHALALMVEMMREDGYIIMDEQVVLTSSPRYQIEEISVDAIYREAERRGIDIGERLQERLKEAEADAKRKLEELEALLQSGGLRQ